MRKLFVLAVAAALLVGITVVPVLAAGQAAEKATGSVELGGGGGWTRHASFNAHEAVDGTNRVAKGKFYWIMTHPTKATITHDVDIDTVEVTGNQAAFSGISTSTNSIWDGHRLFVRVTDGGTPGTAGDVFELYWDDQGLPYYGYNVLAGNLVVHN